MEIPLSCHLPDGLRLPCKRDGRQNWVTICTPTGARISWQPFQATETENMHVFRVKKASKPYVCYCLAFSSSLSLPAAGRGPDRPFSTYSSASAKQHM